MLNWICLTLTVPILDEEKKIKSKDFMKAGLHKTFWGTTKKWEDKYLT